VRALRSSGAIFATSLISSHDSREQAEAASHGELERSLRKAWWRLSNRNDPGDGNETVRRTAPAPSRPKGVALVNGLRAPSRICHSAPAKTSGSLLEVQTLEVIPEDLHLVWSPLPSWERGGSELLHPPREFS